MHSLSDEQIDFIDADIKNRGIKLKELQENLLDHICCVIENEISEEEDFYKFYESVLPRFFKKELSKIQTETDNLLKFKNFYTMKKLLKISGIATVALTILGSLFKTFHLPGAGIFLLSWFITSVVFLSLLIILKLKDNEKLIDRIVISSGFLLAILIIGGLVFKVMHWPLAGVLLYSTIVFTFIYVPVYFLTRFRRPEQKFNVAVNSVLMMACGGVFYSLFNLNGSHYYKENLVENHQSIHKYSEQLFANNIQLISNDTLPESVNHFHQNSISINEDLEKLVEVFLVEKSTEEIATFIRNLDEKMGIYNNEIESLNVPNIISLEQESLKSIRKTDPEVSLTVLARIQQQIAVNENTFISNLLVMK